MKLIALEEHFSAGRIPGVTLPRSKEAFLRGTCPGAPFFDDRSYLWDLDEKRLAYMDACGVDIQVLCTTSGQALPAETAVDGCAKINNFLADEIAKHPDRFRGYASVPTAVPEACADELERSVKELGLVGCMIGGRTEDGNYLNAECYEPLFAKAEELGVPIYLHPGIPTQPVIDECYTKGLPEKTATVLSMYGYGWHVDPGIHFLNLLLSGVFDRHPGLQIILGHWGELVPYFKARFDDALPAAFTGLAHDPGYYLKNNLYVTPSGIYAPENLAFCKEVLGADRILFSMDFPWVTAEGMDRILANPSLTAEEREMIAHGNAEKLFGI